MLRTYFLTCLASLCWLVSPTKAQVSCNGTITTLASSPQSAPLGTPIVLTATVSQNSAPVTSGMVTFLDAGSPIPGSTTALNSDGVATFNATLSPGLHTITAAFNGACTFPRAFVFVVADPQPAINIASSANPAVYGAPLTITITLAPSVTGVPCRPAGSYSSMAQMVRTSTARSPQLLLRSFRSC